MTATLPPGAGDTVHIFVSYSHADQRWVEKTDSHSIIPSLAQSLARRGVELWFDHSLIPGDKYKDVIESRIARAHIAILLVSQHFLDSDFIRDVELPLIEARTNVNELQVIPILTGYCDWHELKLIGSRHLIPGGPTPLIDFVAEPAAWDQVRHEIFKAVRTQVDRIRERRATRVDAVVPATAAVASIPTAVRPRSGRSRNAVVATLIAAVGAGAYAAWRLQDTRTPGAPSGPGAAAPRPATMPAAAPPMDEVALDRELASYTTQARKLPMSVAVLRPKLQPIAETFWSRANGRSASARSAAVAYRLYAASILMSPSSGTFAEIRTAAPWIRRALEKDAGFTDKQELEVANAFFLDVLISQPRDLDLRRLLQNEYRVAMIEVSAAEVTRQVDVGIKAVTDILAGGQRR